MDRRRRSILVGLLGVVLVAGGVFVVLRLLAALVLPPSVTTDVGEYRGVLKQWSASGLVGHFPPAVPPQASGVRFSSFPGFLQGGGHIQLRVRLPIDEVRRIEARLRQAASHAYAGGGKYDHYDGDQETVLPTTSFHTADDPAERHAFPGHYTLYVLHAEDHGGEWNHGETRGTAVSSVANEVVYWAESW